MDYNKIYKEVTALLKTANADFQEAETIRICCLFSEHNKSAEACFRFYMLLLQTRQLLYRYNLHLDYEPFRTEGSEAVVWDRFRITDGTQTKFEVSIDSSFTIARIEDNLSALYF